MFLVQLTPFAVYTLVATVHKLLVQLQLILFLIELLIDLIIAHRAQYLIQFGTSWILLVLQSSHSIET